MHNAQCIISYTDNMVETKQHTLCHPERSRRRSRRISSGASLRHHRPQAYTQNVIPSVVEESLTTPMAHLFIKTAPCAVFPAILHCSFFIAKEAASLPLLLKAPAPSPGNHPRCPFVSGVYSYPLHNRSAPTSPLWSGSAL